jgi:hypothetical protein
MECGRWTLKSTACYDLNGNIIGYLFSIMKDGQYLGYIVVGNSSYNFDMLEAVSGAPLPSISAKEAQAIFAAAGEQVGNLQPQLVYLGYRQFYSVYNTGNNQVAIDMTSNSLIDISVLTSSLATPQQYQQNYVNIMSSLDQSVQPDSTYSNPLPVPLENDQNAPNSKCCGPTAGAMISEYWHSQYWLDYFPAWTQDEVELYSTMDCNNWFPLNQGTAPWNFGPGFVQYATNNGDLGFSSDWCLNRSFSAIQTQINSGCPMGVMFSYWPGEYANWHWCVVTGYDSSGDIIMNDPDGGNYSSTNWAAIQLHSVITRIQY